MIKQIAWLDGLEREIIGYSDKALVDTIRSKAQNVDAFDRIAMWFCEEDELYGCVWISISSSANPFMGNMETIYLHKIFLQEEEFHDVLKECQRVKRMLERNFPDTKVTSNFR